MKNSASSVSSISSLITSSDTAPLVPTYYPTVQNPPPQKYDCRISRYRSSNCLLECGLNCRAISVGLCFESVCTNRCTWSSSSAISNARVSCPEWSAVSSIDILLRVHAEESHGTAPFGLGYYGLQSTTSIRGWNPRERS